MNPIYRAIIVDGAEARTFTMNGMGFGRRLMLKFVSDEDIYYSEALCYFDVTVKANETYKDFVL